jgi:hypothetical protein
MFKSTIKLSTVAGNEKANNGREPKTCLGQVFNHKLGCQNDVYLGAWPHVYFKTRPWFSPVSLSLSMTNISGGSFSTILTPVFLIFQCTVLSGVGEEAVIATKPNTAVDK